MATATEKWSGRQLDKRPDTWTASREWHVIEAANELAAITAAGVQINDDHDLAPRLKCDGISAKLEGFKIYAVTANYSIPKDGEQHTGPGAGADIDDDPLLQPPKIRWNRVRESIPFEEDRNGNPVVNSAKVPFDPPPQKLTGWLELVITRNEPYFDVQKSNEYSYTVNSNSFNVLGSGVVTAGQVLCVDIIPTSEYTAEAQYVEVAYVFWLKPDGHGARMLDQGREYLPTGATESRPIMTTDDNGSSVPVSEFQLLDGTGAPYADATITGAGTPQGATMEDTGYAVFLTYQGYAAKDFANLSL